jgi:hypothetical protein
LNRIPYKIALIQRNFTNILILKSCKSTLYSTGDVWRQMKTLDYFFHLFYLSCVTLTLTHTMMTLYFRMFEMSQSSKSLENNVNKLITLLSAL